MSDQTNNGYMKLPRAARYCDVGETTLRRAAQSGEVRGVQRGKGGHWSFLAADLDAWVKGEPARESA